LDERKTLLRNMKADPAVRRLLASIENKKLSSRQREKTESVSSGPGAKPEKVSSGPGAKN
jgi:hypothetical protein